MIKLRSSASEYIFTKIIDNEPLNMKLIEAIDSENTDENIEKYRSDIGGGFVKGPSPIDLCHHESFHEMASIAESFAIECSHEYNKNVGGNHEGRLNSQSYFNTHIANTKCYLMWGIRYKSGDYTKPHNHWPATWTFTYYIDPPANASELFFPDLNYELNIEHGLLTLIKGDVVHGVKRKKFEGNRYCIVGLISTNILDIQGYLTLPKK